MKKIISLVALLLAMVMLLSACIGRVKSPEDTDGSTTGTTADDPAAADAAVTENKEDTALPTEEQEEKPEALSAEKEFYNMLNKDWYRRALGCTFEKPEEIDAYFFFYIGVGANEQATDEERALILEAYKKKNPNSGNPEEYSSYYIRLPVEKINEGLSVFGVTIEDIEIPDRWAYIEKTDAYYFWVSDAYGVGRWSVTKVEKGEDGMVAVYWEPEGLHYNTATGAHMQNAKMVMTLQEQPDGTYRILSNVPQE